MRPWWTDFQKKVTICSDTWNLEQRIICDHNNDNGRVTMYQGLRGNGGNPQKRAFHFPGSLWQFLLSFKFHWNPISPANIFALEPLRPSVRPPWVPSLSRRWLKLTTKTQCWELLWLVASQERYSLICYLPRCSPFTLASGEGDRNH